MTTIPQDYPLSRIKCPVDLTLMGSIRDRAGWQVHLVFKDHAQNSDKFYLVESISAGTCKVTWGRTGAKNPQSQVILAPEAQRRLHSKIKKGYGYDPSTITAHDMRAAVKQWQEEQTHPEYPYNIIKVCHPVACSEQLADGRRGRYMAFDDSGHKVMDLTLDGMAEVQHRWAVPIITWAVRRDAQSTKDLL